MDDSGKSAAEKKAARSNIMEEHIRLQQKRREERSFLEELGKRVGIAREGKTFSEKQEYGKAIALYRRFLSITARAVSVEVEDLRPQLFEEKTRRGECLLLSSILFDMLKILDKLNTDTAKEERKLYHRMFIRFTVDQPFQLFAAENLRKYLIYRKSVNNKSEFWATYQAIKVKKFCVVASWAYGSPDAPAVVRLRSFRDETLSRSPWGRCLVRAYYRNGTKVAGLLGRLPGSRPVTRQAIRAFLWVIRTSSSSNG